MVQMPKLIYRLLKKIQKINKPKFALCLEKKPRASKSSKRHTIGGIPFFFKANKDIGGLKIYYDKPPYPYLKAIPSWFHWTTGHATVEEMSKKAEKWILDNFQTIIGGLKNLDKCIQINEELFREQENEERINKRNGKVSNR